MNVNDEKDDNNVWTPEEKSLYVFTASSYKKGNIGLGIYDEVTTKSNKTVRNQRSLRIGDKAKAPLAEIGLRSIEAAIDLLGDAYSREMTGYLGPLASTTEYTIISTNWAAVLAIRNTEHATTPHRMLLGSIMMKTEAICKRG